jgi:type IV pilus assembly protein PilM
MLPQPLKAKLHRFFEPRLPAVACEVNRRSIVLLRLDPKNASSIDRFSLTPLPAGLLVPSLIQPNISSMPDFLAILKAAFAKADIRTQRISVAISDASAKVAVHQLDMLAGNEDEKQQMLRWKLRKSIPYNIEDAHLSYLEHKEASGKYAVLTVCIHKEVLSQYEEAFQKLGMHAGYISLSSFAAFELLVRVEPELWQRSVLFLRVRNSGISSLIVQQGIVVFFRHLEYETADETPSLRGRATVDEVSPDLYDELHPSIMYYQDKLSKQSLDKIYVSCPQDPPATLLSSLSERFGCPVLNLDSMSFLQSSHAQSLRPFKSSLIPSLGLALGRF